ncbi:uncharacterized protein LOC119571891 [Penaeus monodon]|uniref:uncharacterized protein LOC119571891 n=1 Tax=Penaeus monodon TaxID=6687 RepID=UPI0018A71309|nr:uncharacterized protein LOC119571891 [Penaeus monodon]
MAAYSEPLKYLCPTWNAYFLVLEEDQEHVMTCAKLQTPVDSYEPPQELTLEPTEGFCHYMVNSNNTVVDKSIVTINIIFPAAQRGYTKYGKILLQCYKMLDILSLGKFATKRCAD